MGEEEGEGGESRGEPPRVTGFVPRRGAHPQLVDRSLSGEEEQDSKSRTKLTASLRRDPVVRQRWALRRLTL